MTTTKTAQKTAYSILFTVAFAHCINDLLQATIPAMYPVLKESYQLTFAQVGLITFAYQFTASLLQPLVGIYTDKNPKPFSLAAAMGFTLVGILCLAFATSFYTILGSVALIGIGSSIFHPEASRVAYLGSGGKRGLAQSIFQLGGNFGTALGPLLIALVVASKAQTEILKFLILALLGIAVLFFIGKWYNKQIILGHVKPKSNTGESRFSSKTIKISLAILITLMFSKAFYLASMTNYYTFYLINKFGVGVEKSQILLFIFLGSVALGTFLGGPLGDKFGRKYIIWISILGAAPFALALPYVGLNATIILSVLIGLIMSSAFSAILVFAQELMPNKLGTISGIFYGLSFGLGGLGSAVLGYFADMYSIETVYQITAFLPLLGIFAYFLPNIKPNK
nr:MFS transporter [uncultured Flavobacterium sp.]